MERYAFNSVHILRLVALCQKAMFVLGCTAIIFGSISNFQTPAVPAAAAPIVQKVQSILLLPHKTKRQIASIIMTIRITRIATILFFTNVEYLPFLNATSVTLQDILSIYRTYVCSCVISYEDS
jgi:hypothetical protein